MLIASTTITILGIPWDGTFVAAVVAAVAAAASGWFTHRQVKSLNARQLWFSRYTLGMSQLQSRNNRLQLAGITMLKSLSEAKWATSEDRETTLVAMELFEDKMKRRPS